MRLYGRISKINASYAHSVGSVLVYECKFTYMCIFIYLNIYVQCTYVYMYIRKYILLHYM